MLLRTERLERTGWQTKALLDAQQLSLVTGCRVAGDASAKIVNLFQHRSHTLDLATDEITQEGGRVCQCAKLPSLAFLHGIRKVLTCKQHGVQDR